ncbi:Rap1a/Tai family immunity protein [Kaistia sp. MMO-174]|uniref:Rap1a/Tai family immunity protein n=1 Tax=Kaistia sp. MMO-174 TaxID=3081256 RepID=UPI00301A3028
MYSNLPWYGKALCLAAFFAISGSSFASADWQNGNKLYEGCEDHTSFNLGYIEGVIDTLGADSGKFCIPANVIAKQLKDVVCKDLRESPKDRDRLAAFLVFRSLQRAWPCK